MTSGLNLGPPNAPPSVGEAASRLRRTVSNWYSAGVLAAFVLPSRIPPRRGVHGTWLGRIPITFRIADGSIIRCRVRDAGDVLSVFVDGDYRRMQIPWAELRTVVDVGSTVGSFAVWAARRCPGARVIAVEPNPQVYPFLLDNIARNGLSERVVAIEVALGKSNGSAAIEDDDAISTLVRVVPETVGRGAVVTMLTIDELFRSNRLDHCDLLKLDCEGGEYDILLNASPDVLRSLDTVVCEYHPVPNHEPSELITLFQNNGFEVEADGTPLGFIMATRPHSTP
ncbi:MAG TPA: FkbM family methyltransferase [Blastocatellia bacterium]|nr:FkbM family methyltransferase [Blastocatellia bacterium]